MKPLSIIFVVLFAAGLMTACGKRAASGIVGHYKGEYFGGVEDFVFNSDGSFTQSFSVNGKPLYTNRGSWTLDGRTMQLKNFLKAYWFTDDDFSSFRKPLDEFSAILPVGTDAIMFSRDAEYFVRKQ